jgi:hypothetical protein
MRSCANFFCSVEAIIAVSLLSVNSIDRKPEDSRDGTFKFKAQRLDKKVSALNSSMRPEQLYAHM